MSRIRLMTRVLFLFALTWASCAYGGNTIGVILSWDPPATDADTNASSIVSYHLFYGTASKVYTNSITVSSSDYDFYGAGYIISSLPEGPTYYFAVSATDNDGNNSALSSEASVALPIPKPVVLQSELYTDGYGDPVYLELSGTNSTATDWDIQTSTDLLHWTNLNVGSHGIDVFYDAYDIYFEPGGRLFYRVVDK